ncbi:HAMP domain-containing histidine kinase [Ideonella paludis]|uniref:histidine kinase n=1 Tax=Ideonella paludis TaxID=1233411 RepID=A0ABS5DWY6_9BURK|nr:HAMP domain-containing histidine kinase [Ideonella paludis]
MWTRGSQLLLPARIPLRLRVFFRGAFALLALATLGLALSVLIEEKIQGLQSYTQGFAKTLGQISDRLRHPTGQLALLNPSMAPQPGVGLRPVVLPFSAIDFDDRAKVQQAVEMAGCGVRYALPGGQEAQLCVAIGSSPLAGGFIYAVGSVPSPALVARRVGERDLSAAHRVRVTLQMRGQTSRWMAPFEAGLEPLAAGSSLAQRGRLTGFVEGEDGQTADKPVRDFRGWLWRDLRCLGPVPSAAASAAEPEDCLRQAFFSVRLPVEVFRDDLHLRRAQVVWPPADLDRMLLRVQVLPPGADSAPLFDSAQGEPTAPFSLQALQALLLPGETLNIRSASGAQVAELSGQVDKEPSAPLMDALIRRLPVDGYDTPLVARETIRTSLGTYELTLTGDVRSVNRQLSVVATRVAWFVGAMLLAVLLTWLAIELRIIRRITVLTQRAARVSQEVKGPASAVTLDVADLRGADELGLLAGTLGDLMQRVNDDVRREHLRVQQEKDQWHAVGHEIMSPLQSLMALHGSAEDPSHRYIQRMQQAIKVLYGQASPTEAFEATTLGVQALDIAAFLRQVAQNAPHAGIEQVVLEAPASDTPLRVRADEYALEDVVTHVLSNADRYRTPGSPIELRLMATEQGVEVQVHNQGPQVPAELLERVFDYGVSDEAPLLGDTREGSHRGQGLFVARTYMAKMGGTIRLDNTPGGVTVRLSLLGA